MLEDADLRQQLVNFRETVIYAENPATAECRKCGILRRAMIDWLVTSKPHDAAELIFGPPAHLKKNTDRNQIKKYGMQVIAIINRHQRHRVLRMRA
ncbi:hypothetical protein [uncultured Paracoccus sp.]|uniref:hypothetical protein n=1 Tax=uncultured Paracoccus sp. TaxID=189685 RepID=UPI00260FF52C|nr:hypothetical protein [uncultured Paracoccus sp.]